MKKILRSSLVKTDADVRRPLPHHCLPGLANFRTVIQHSESLLLRQKIQNLASTPPSVSAKDRFVSYDEIWFLGSQCAEFMDLL
jgi:hypothetical protein